MSRIEDWYLGFAQSEEIILTKVQLDRLINATIEHLQEDNLFIDGITLGPMPWRIDSNEWHWYIGKESKLKIKLSRDIDYADYSDEENNYLMTIWNTYGRNYLFASMEEKGGDDNQYGNTPEIVITLLKEEFKSRLKKEVK